MGDGIETPPDGLSIREQARWWAQKPEKYLEALLNGAIIIAVDEEFERIEQDNALAMKIADRSKVDGLTQGERERLYFLLTDGEELNAPKQGAPSKALSDLQMAHSIRDITDQQERKQLLRVAIVDESGAMAGEDSIRKRIKRIEDLWRQVSQFNPNAVEMLLIGLEGHKDHNPDDPANLDQTQILSLLEVYSKLFEEGATKRDFPEIS